MSGTSKTIVSMCVLLLAALVVYYGMTPPEAIQGQLVDVPKQRPSLFGGDPNEKLIAMGIPPIATKLTNKPEPVIVALPVDPVDPMLPPERVVIELDPVVVLPETVTIIENTYKLYTVLEGETLSEIASSELGSYRMWRDIASLNNITDPSRVMPGRVLRMPMRNTKPFVTPVLTPVVIEGATTHTIEEGDTMSSIAGDYYDDVNKYGVIVRANPSIDPSRLKIGTVLTIPDI
jgi:nucleoid-associated protein YgaU